MNQSPDKSSLRRQARERRRRAAELSPDASQRLASFADSVLDAFRHWCRGGRPDARLTVALYRARGSEIDPDRLGQVLLQRGWELCLPVVMAPAAPLRFRAWAPGQPLLPDLAGSPAPLPEAAEVRPDLILCPLLAFDRLGGRLGQGGGYYDRTLAERPEALAIGLAYAAQQVERLPMDEHDKPLHGVLTEIGYLPTRKDT